MNKVSTFNTFREVLFQLFRENKYNYIYVSLGSKINEKTVLFHYPSSHLKLNSNAPYQMIPMFLRQQPETNKILCIIIDDFHDNELLEINNAFIDKTKNTYSNMSFITLDCIITIKSIQEYLTLIFDTLIYYKISPTRFMFTNFICFKSPNHLQIDFESKLIGTLEKIFNNANNGIYNICYYQWYNYSYYTYNYIYCYKNYSIHRLMFIQQLQHIMKNTIKNETLNNINCNIITNYIESCDDRIKSKWMLFFDNSINFVES